MQTFTTLFTGLVVFISVSVQAKTSDLNSIISTQEKIKKLGFERAMGESQWPVVLPPPLTGDHQDNLNSQIAGDNDLPWDDCNFGGTGFGCPGSYTDPVVNQAAYKLKDDAVQVLAVETLYQTLTFFKVKHVFGKLKGKVNTYGFKVIDPVEGAPFQDLDTDTVVYAIKQFRKYILGLLCNEANPSRVLGMMNQYDVGLRFRWDMAWALLGNDLPDAPNKFMKFGMKWRRFSAAMDGIENGSMLRVRNAFGGTSTFDPGGWNQSPQPPNVGNGTNTPTAQRVGYVAREVISIIRLVGDVASATLDLFCVSDLSVSSQKEADKKAVVYKLLEVKKKALDRYGPLLPLLENISKKATEAAGQPVTVLP